MIIKTVIEYIRDHERASVARNRLYVAKKSQLFMKLKKIGKIP